MPKTVEKRLAERKEANRKAIEEKIRYDAWKAKNATMVETIEKLQGEHRKRGELFLRNMYLKEVGSTN